MKDEQMVTILNSGRANEYMLAYMEIAMKNAGFSEDDIIRAEHAMLNVLDTYTAAEALKKAKGEHGAKKNHPNKC